MKRIYLGLVLCGLALAGCTPNQQALIGAPAIARTVMDPAVPVQDKACSVLEWGIPIAQQRAATLTIAQQSLANTAMQAASAYCAGKNLAWQERAIAAADVLSKILWDKIR